MDGDLATTSQAKKLNTTLMDIKMHILSMINEPIVCNHTIHTGSYHRAWRSNFPYISVSKGCKFTSWIDKVSVAHSTSELWLSWHMPLYQQADNPKVKNTLIVINTTNCHDISPAAFRDKAVVTSCIVSVNPLRLRTQNTPMILSFLITYRQIALSWTWRTSFPSYAPSSQFHNKVKPMS